MSESTSASDCPALAMMDEVLAAEPDAVRCPFPAYAKQQEERPVVYSERLNGWLVTRHDDAVQVLLNPAKFSSKMAAGPSSVSALAQQVLDNPSFPERTRRAAQRRMELSKSRVLIYSDPPLHKRQRSLVSAGFTPRRVAALDSTVETLANDLIDKFVERGQVDLVPSFSIPIPMTIIATLLGVPPSKMATFKEWSNAFTQGVGALSQSDAAVIDMFEHVDAFYDYFSAELEVRRQAPVDDLLSDLIAARLEGEQPLSEAEILQMLVQFLVAGNETTTNLLSSTTLKLAQAPDLQKRLRDQPSEVPKFIEEVLRLESPIQGVWRVATEEVEIGGVNIPAESLIYVISGAANRDPNVYPDPTELNIDAGHDRTLAFGRGEHVCLGMSLAKLEAKVAIGVLLRRLGDIALAVEPETLAYHRSFVLHGPKSLPISFTPMKP